MIKNILSVMALSLVFLLSGCGGSEGEEQLSIQQNLDKGNYDAVITKLEDKENKDDNDNMALGAAYMGRAGSALPVVLAAMSNDDKEQRDSSASEFVNFVKNISESSGETSLTDLSKSKEYYAKVLKKNCAERDLNRSDSEKDICLFIGLGSTTKTAITIDLLAEDIKNLGSEEFTDEKLKSATCAIQYAYNGEYDQEKCSIVEGGAVEFQSLENKMYTPLTVTINASLNQYYYLMSMNDILLTKGYCALDDFGTRVDSFDNLSEPYPCPINETLVDEEFKVLDVLVTVLNDGLGSIKAAVSEDVQDDIDKYTEEITGSVDGNVTASNIIDYINKQNGE